MTLSESVPSGSVLLSTTNPFSSLAEKFRVVLGKSNPCGSNLSSGVGTRGTGVDETSREYHLQGFIQDFSVGEGNYAG